MGSQSDWATMRHAAETLAALGVAHETRIVSAHRTPERLYAFAKGAQGERLQGHHRRRRRRRAPAGHDRGDDRPCRCSACRSNPRRCRASIRSTRSCRCRPAFRSARWRSARPARSTPRCSPRACSRSTTPALAHAARRLAQAADRRGGRAAGRDRRDASDPVTLKPGATIGILGGGQLGRMLALAAARLGFRCHVYSPDPDSPAFDVVPNAHLRRL